MPRVLRIPFSTNVERVALAAGIKDVGLEWVDVDADDRAAVIALSDQELVPVLETDDHEVIADSMAIVAWLEAQVPEPALWPADPARRAEVDAFVDWFNDVWKVAPNAIAGRGDPTGSHGAELRGSLDRFEGLLEGRDFLMGNTVGAADVCAFPFLKYGLLRDPADDEPFHVVLATGLALGGAFPRLEAWIRRVDALPRR